MFYWIINQIIFQLENKRTIIKAIPNNVIKINFSEFVPFKTQV